MYRVTMSGFHAGRVVSEHETYEQARAALQRGDGRCGRDCECAGAMLELPSGAVALARDVLWRTEAEVRSYYES